MNVLRVIMKKPVDVERRILSGTSDATFEDAAA